MSIVVQKIPGRETSRIFIFEGKIPSFPSGENMFEDRDNALKSGFYVAGDILGNHRAKAVKSFHSNRLPGYNNGFWDCIEITLNPGYSWDNPVKGTQTVADKYAEIFQSNYFEKKQILFQDPKASGNDLKIVGLINTHIKTAFDKAASTAEEVTQRRNAGISPTVYDTVKIDHGHVEAKSYINGILTVVFSGNCGSDCVNKSTSSTETSLKADLRGPFPFIQQYAFIKQ